MNRKIYRFHQSGSSLLEILITMIIIAIGLMGFASMMVQSMKANRAAMQRSLATFYAYNIIDCMRVNRQAAIAGDYNRSYSTSTPAASTSNMADNDLNLWLTSLSGTLPSGEAQITVLSNTVTVRIRWSENLTSGEQALHVWRTVSAL